MLWVNMIMDTFAALALATEPPHERLLEKPPHDRDAYIVTKVIILKDFYSLIYRECSSTLVFRLSSKPSY